MQMYKILNDIIDYVYNGIFVTNSHSISLRSRQDLTILSLNNILKDKILLRYFDNNNNDNSNNKS